MTHVRLNICPVLALLLGAMASPALARIAVSSFGTAAQANAYAPLDRSAYFATDSKPSVSPAVAGVSADWSGTNVGGSTNTWRMVASADISTTTTINPNLLSITGGGAFSYDLTTTADFVDPTSVTTLFSPQDGSGYSCQFTIDSTATYSMSAQLQADSYVNFFGPSGNTIFSRINVFSVTVPVSVSGTIMAGQYTISTGTNMGPPNLPPGINHQAANGSFSGFSFSVQIPEPAGALFVCSSLPVLTRRPWRRRSCVAGLRQ